MLENGVFTATNVRVEGLRTDVSGAVTLGFRAEDASVGEGGQVNAPIYSLELLGDATMITVRSEGALLSVKASKDYRANIGDPVSALVPPEICHLFSAETGERI
jgi:multiple sugar transport system ATP-binding protein